MDEEYYKKGIKGRHLGPNGNGDGLMPRALTWEQVEALPDPEYIVKGILDRGTLAEMYGPKSSGKSFLALDLGLHVAAGWDWQGRRVHQGGVLYVSAEGGASIKRRMKAFAQHHKLDLAEIAFCPVIEPINLLDPSGVQQVIVDTSVVPALSLVILDTAARVMPGGKEDTEDMGKFVAACDEIRLVTGAAVLIVHHTGKDVSRGSRGASNCRLPSIRTCPSSRTRTPRLSPSRSRNYATARPASSAASSSK